MTRGSLRRLRPWFGRGRWRSPRRGRSWLARLTVALFLSTTLALAVLAHLAGRLSVRLSAAPKANLFAAEIVQAAGGQGLDPVLVAAVVQAESGFNPSAVSARGARGLMQILPATWRELNPQSKCRGDHPPPARGKDCIFDPGASLAAGTRYLKALLVRFGGDTRLALAAYNAGQGAVERAAARGEQGAVPAFPETRRYTQTVLDAWAGERLGLTGTQVEGLVRLAALARWLVLADALLLAILIVGRPEWTGGRGR